VVNDNLANYGHTQLTIKLNASCRGRNNYCGAKEQPHNNRGQLRRYNVGQLPRYNVGQLRRYNVGQLRRYNVGQLRRYNVKAGMYFENTRFGSRTDHQTF
jgi:hypothetical protein